MENLNARSFTINSLVQVFIVLVTCLFTRTLNAQTFPGMPGFTLPAGKTIIITYDVDVNPSVCPTGTIPSDISNQSSVSGSNFSTVLTDDPSNPAPNPSPTLTPVAGLTLGNLVYKDVNTNGVFDAGDTGINGVLLRIYLDDGDNVLDAGDGSPLATTTTAGGGLYSFTPICPGNYIVEIAPSNFNVGGSLYDNGLMAAFVSSPIGGATDPDDDVNNDDNGDPVAGFGIASSPITLTLGGEPVNDGDADNSTNLSLDFGFKTPTLVSINDVTLNEGTGGSTTSFSFTATRTNNAEAFSLTVNSMDGTAVNPSDFTAISGGTVSFTAGGSLTQTITVLVNHDNIVEANETFSVLLSGAPAGVVITDGTGLGTITNDDAAIVTLTGGVSQNEGTSFVFTATLNNPVQSGFSIAYTTNNGTATVADNDYTDNDGPALVFTGTSGESHTVTVNTTTDNKVELNETFTVALGAITGGPAGITTAGSPQTGTILNDDAAVVSLAGNVSQAENLTPQVFTVNLSNPVDVPVTVQFSTSDGTATAADNDYTALTNQLVTFSAGSTIGQAVNVTITNDTKVEADEVYNVALNTLNASGRNVTLGTVTGTGTIVNNDAATVTLSGGISLNEGNSGATMVNFSATLNNAVQGGFTANYTTNDGTATTADLDYADNDGSLIFTGTAGEVKMFSVAVNGDLNIESDETFQTAINSLTGLPIPGTVTIVGSPQTTTILNDELDYGDAPTAAQSGFAGTYPTTLANNGARHTLVPGGLHLGSTVDADTDGQPNATSTGDGADEDGVTLPASFITGLSSSITVNASGAGVLNAWLDFNRDGDWSDAGEQIFTNTAVVAGNNVLSVNVPAGASLGTSFARFRISTASGLSFTGLAANGEVEDYQVQLLDRAIAINDVTLAEGNAGTTTFTFTVSLNTPAGPGGVTFDITTQNNTATTGNNDYVSNTLVNQTIPEGGTMYSFNVTVNGDLTIEDNETFFVNLTNVVGAGVADAQGVGTINNDDSATLTLTGGIAQNEGNAGTVAYIYTATLNTAVQGGFQVAYTTDNSTATTTDNDYIDNDGALVFTGTAGETKTITVLVNGDNKVELNETFSVALGTISATSPTQAAAITKVGSPQTGTITNDDSAVVAIAGNVSQAENLTPQVFSVTLSNPVDVAVTVQFSTSDGTATTGDNDYNGITNQLVTFSAGTTTTQSVNVTINNDNKVENTEIYNVGLNTLNASGRNVTLGTASGTGTITNDDAAIVTLTGTQSIAEGNSGTTPFVFNATLNNPVQGGFSIAYTTNDGTATTADTDYTDNDATLVFAGTGGEVKMITVLGVGDLNIETDESFTVSLGAITGAPAGVTTAGSPQTGTLLNDELDWGDAPSAAQSGFIGTYPTLLANNGPRHTLLPGGLHLGATVEADPDGQPNATASGDGADEDGVTFPSAIVINTSANITVNASATGVLNAWVDFNRDGDWADAGEQIFTNQAVVAGNNALSFAVPGSAALGNSFGRFRISTAPGLTFTGAAADGEVEDYAINIVNTQFSIDDPTVVEGNAGTSNLVFTISRTNNSTNASVNYQILGGSAQIVFDTDYILLPPGTATFTAGGALSQTITVLVNGDLKVELDETIFVGLSSPVNGDVLDGLGIGTIINDDAAIVTITSPTVIEGDAGVQTMTFNISISNEVDADVSMNFATMDGSATSSDPDYVGGSSTLNFPPLDIDNPLFISIYGDCTIEPDEIFQVILSALNANGRNVTFSGGGATLTGTGTIINEDFPPVISCPPNITISCEASSAPANTGMATATDDCSPAPGITFNDAITPGSCTNNYTITRTWKATDGTNDIATCTQVITVQDITPPSLTCPAPVTVSCAGDVPAPNIALVTNLTDNCGGAITVTHVSDVIIAGSCANRFTVNRTYRATDVCGNSSTCLQVITVNDVTAPVLTCPAPITVTCSSNVPLPNTTLVTGVSDNCPGAPVVTFVSDVITNQTCFNRYTLTRTYRATDACGNSATCTQTITVFDNVPPSITCPANITVQCASAVPAPAPGSIITSDNCTGGAPTVTFVNDVISNQTCANRFIVTRTYRSTDVCGNSATCTQTITVFDNTAPTITFTDPLLQGVSNGGTFEVQCFGQDPDWEVPTLSIASINAVDNCAGTVTVVYTDALIDEGNCAVDGYINRYKLTWTATDVCGNVSTAFVFMNLVDHIPPVFEGIPADITVACDAIPQPPIVTATDECLCACGIQLVQSTPNPGCQNGQVITRTWTTSDLCGNVTTAVQHITLQDVKGPVLILIPSPLTGISQDMAFDYTCNEGGIPAFYESLNAGSVMSPPSCGGGASITFSETIIEARNCEFSGYVEERTYQWTGTDACGNKTTLTIQVHLIDDEEPVIVGVPEVTCIGDPSLKEIEVIDNCGNGNLRFWDVQIPNPCGTGNAIRRTYEGFDPCGNMVRDTAILLPNDHIGPEMKFVNPVLADLEPGEVLTVDCASGEDQYTSFGVDDVHAIDQCSKGLEVTFNEKLIATGDCATTGIIASLLLEWTATDICGNASKLTAQVDIVDHTSPELPGFDDEITIGCNDTLPGIIATDNCQQIIISTRDSIIAGDCDFEYDIVRKINAVDACGNSISRTQVVHVGDGSGPLIEGVVAELCDDLSIPEVTAYDKCSGKYVPVAMVQDTLDSACRDGLIILRTWSAKDLCGNLSVVKQTIVLNDKEAPEILIPTWSIILKFLDNRNNVVRLSQKAIMQQLNVLDDGSVYVEDECDLQIIPVFTLVSELSGDCQSAGYYERRIYTWTATDVCGNVSIVSFSVDVIDDLPPVLSVIPVDTKITCAPLPPVPSIQADDAAQPVTITFSESIVPGNTNGEFDVTRLWVATDACGNMASASQHILWIPNTFIECSIVLPIAVECSTHGVVISSIVTDGVAPYTYEWAIEGDDYLLQSGQGTPQVTIYIGFSPVDISLTVTDNYGCETVCTATLDCVDPLDGLVIGQTGGTETISNPTEEIEPAQNRFEDDSYLQKIFFWPNPASEKLNVSFTSPKDQEVGMRLFNTTGQHVIISKVTSLKGKNEYSFDVSSLTEGSYILEIQTEKEIYSRLIMLLRNK